MTNNINHITVGNHNIIKIKPIIEKHIYMVIILSYEIICDHTIMEVKHVRKKNQIDDYTSDD